MRRTRLGILTMVLLLLNAIPHSASREHLSPRDCIVGGLKSNQQLQKCTVNPVRISGRNGFSAVCDNQTETSLFCTSSAQDMTLHRGSYIPVNALSALRGGKGGIPKLFGFSLPSCGLNWALGIGFGFKDKRKCSTNEHPKVDILKNPMQSVMMQAFDWASMPDREELYSKILKEVPDIASAGINTLWFPPPSSSADPHGYMPGRWYEIPFKTQLLEALKASRLHGIMSLVDVVLNHRTATRESNVTRDWTSFEAPDWEEWAVVRDDWKCAPHEKEAFCPANCSTCGAPDSGENACFAPDIDHTNPRVQADTAAWLLWLREALGFDGLRLDNTKGYAPEAVGRYLAAVKPSFAVGEYFDTNRDLLTAWLKRAGPAVSTFDFGLRYKLKDAIAADDYGVLLDQYFGPMLHYAADRAVTFLDNHDTAGDLKDRFGSQEAIEKGYAFLLTHPGVPCIFWGDWLGPARPVIRELLEVRRRGGISSGSGWRVAHAEAGLYAGFVGGAAGAGNGLEGAGAEGGLAVKLGSRGWSPNQGLPERVWQGAASGAGWAVWTRIPGKAKQPHGGPGAAGGV